MSKIETIFWNIMGGIFAGLFLLGLDRLYNFLRAKQFRSFFGVDEHYHIIYCLYNAPKCPKSDSDCQLVFGKSDRSSAGARATSGINLQQVTSVASAKSLGYLVEAFSKNLRNAPKIAADVESCVATRTDISFIAMGGITNYKTCDLLENPSNFFMHFKQGDIISVKNKSPIVSFKDAGEGHDYGIIVKIHPDASPERIWICCAGFGGVGTIGAAYYLSKKWKKLRRYVGCKQFGCVIRSPSGNEESTVATHLMIERTNPIFDRIRRWRSHKDGLKVIEI